MVSTAAATALTPSKSPGEETEKPASTTSTPRPVELRGDLRLLMRLQRDARGLLPVAQRRIEDGDPACCHCSSFGVPETETHLGVSFRSACAPTKGRVVAYSPLAGENGDKENGDEAERCQANQTGGGQCCRSDLDCTIAQVCVNLTRLSTPKEPARAPAGARDPPPRGLRRVSDALATAERRSREAAWRPLPSLRAQYTVSPRQGPQATSAARSRASRLSRTPPRPSSRPAPPVRSPGSRRPAREPNASSMASGFRGSWRAACGLRPRDGAGDRSAGSARMRASGRKPGRGT